MNDDAVLVTTCDGITIVTLNRPDNRNSMTPELLEGFCEATKSIRADTSCRAVIITGTGSCFSAGADFHTAVQMGEKHLTSNERSFQMYEPFLNVLDIKVPVIAALNGHAVGGGFGLALLCDIRIASVDAKYGANFTRLGLHPGMGISYLLPRLIGVSRANDLLFTGRLVLGSEAAQMGLAAGAYRQKDVVNEAMIIAKSIAQNAPIAIRLTKESVVEHLHSNVRAAARREAYAQAATLATNDAEEGINALLAKRNPEFYGS